MNEFVCAMQRVMAGIAQFKKMLSPRDMLMLQIGMRASHIEEALSQGDTTRAEGHLRHLTELVQNLPEADVTGFAAWQGPFMRGYRGPIRRGYTGPWVRRWTGIGR
jgi:hypothetical protein